MKMIPPFWSQWMLPLQTFPVNKLNSELVTSKRLKQYCHWSFDLNCIYFRDKFQKCFFVEPIIYLTSTFFNLNNEILIHDLRFLWDNFILSKFLLGLSENQTSQIVSKLSIHVHLKHITSKTHINLNRYKNRF